MSCEGNRLRFFAYLQTVLGMDAGTLERIYQAGKAAGVPDGKEAEASEKTRLLFRDMQEVGIRPPTHSPDGLPKPDSRAGYAAVLDYLRSHCHPTRLESDWQGDFSVWPLEDLDPRGLDKDGKNRAGFFGHRYLALEQPDSPHEHRVNLWSGRLDGIGPHTGFMETFEALAEEKEAFQAYLAQADAQGYLPDGYHKLGFDRGGWDESGYNLYGLRQDDLKDDGLLKATARRRIRHGVYRPNRVRLVVYELDIEGFSPEDGFRPHDGDEVYDHDRFGFNRLGFRCGRSWTGYDENGLDANGHPAPARPGYDAWGYERKTGLTAPDAQGRRYNLIGWVYDPASGDCVNPDNPAQRMKHEGSWGYSAKYKKVVLKRSYIPDENELKNRLRAPSLHWNEALAGGYLPFLYGVKPEEERLALMAQHSAAARYLRSEARIQARPDAHYLGVYLRCPRCGQFTGAKPHSCPAFGDEKVIVSRGGVIALRKDAFRFGHQYDVVEEMIERDGNLFLTSSTISAVLQDEPWWGEGRITRWKNILRLSGWQKEADETAILLETPNTPLPAYDPDYHGGPFAGFHWKSGLDKEGRDLFGFHYLTKRRADGMGLEDLKAALRVRTMIRESLQVLKQKGKDDKDMLEAAYGRIATSLAGAPRSVSITEDGGPRPDMFWTDMKGRIQAERYPLRNTPFNSELNNLIAMKAGLYHELGHEEDTPVGVFRRILAIAHGEEEVEGLPKEAAGLVAEVYNILEDGRMERAQAKRRRGVANLLAACARIQPRWDEKVGDDVPLAHQVLGMMLYRALPFFRVRPEVFEAAPERVRRLYLDIEPLIDRAMNSPEETFQASIEISRRLMQADPDLRALAERMTREKSQGGRWLESDGSAPPPIILSGLPRPGAAPADRSLPLPAPGWGDPDAEKTGCSQGTAAEEQANAARPQGEAQEPPSGVRRPAAASGAIQTLAPSPELDDSFFSAISASAALPAIGNDIIADIRYGMNSLTRAPLGRALQKPLEAAGNLYLEDPNHPEKIYPIHTPINRDRAAQARIEELRREGREKGRQVARRLETLKEEIHRRARLKTSGVLDRKRFKRALAGAETVYRQQESFDITSLAVSVQLDMSGSMGQEIRSGQLAAVTLALEEALRTLNAEYMVTGFGSEYALFKSFGDEILAPERAAAMLNTTLGGTNAAPAMRLAALGLRETRAANKLHIVLTDGAVYDGEETAKQALEMRRNGILPFGIFFGSESNAPRDQLNQIFGESNWAAIQSLADLPEHVGRRIEQIYRKILATR